MDEGAVKHGLGTRVDHAADGADRHIPAHLPILLTVDEVADLLRTTRTAIYAMAGRGQLPGVTRIRRRLLFRRDVLLDWLGQKHAPSPKELRR